MIKEYDRAQGMDHPVIADFTIEHIMPKTYCDAWSDVIIKSKHHILKDLWGNLVPLSSKMNSTVAQSTFDVKRKAFSKESMFISARQIGDNYDKWGEQEINERTEALIDWAIKRWPRPEKH